MSRFRTLHECLEHHPETTTLWARFRSARSISGFLFLGTIGCFLGSRCPLLFLSRPRLLLIETRVFEGLLRCDAISRA